MDSVDPALTDQAEATLRATPGVLGAGQVRLRWVGRTLRAECEILVDPEGSRLQMPIQHTAGAGQGSR